MNTTLEMLNFKKQLKAIESCMINARFICPKCKNNDAPTPYIENVGEEKTQVYCYAGCGFIYIEDHLPKKGKPPEK